MGERAARHSWPKRLTSGRLLVEVENSGWMYTLTLRKAQLTQGLTDHFGAGLIQELTFRIGEREERKSA